MDEKQLGKGWVFDNPKDKLKDTDIVYGAPDEPFFWADGYDVEKKMRLVLSDSKFKLPVNDQKSTSSCGGQSFSKLAEVVGVLHDKTYPKFRRFSARDIYSHCVLNGGGMYGWDGALRLKNNGILLEDHLPSIAIEDTMRNKGTDGGSFELIRQILKGGVIKTVPRTMDAIAHAMEENGGVVLAILGENNGTWYSADPVPPVEIAQWGHLMYFGKANIYKGKKKLWGLQSWGNVGEGGWQRFGEEWLPWIKGAFTWSPDVENIERIGTYNDIRNYIIAHDLMNFGELHRNWDWYQKHFHTTITFNNFFDFLQMRKEMI